MLLQTNKKTQISYASLLLFFFFNIHIILLNQMIKKRLVDTAPARQSLRPQANGSFRLKLNIEHKATLAKEMYRLRNIVLKNITTERT